MKIYTNTVVINGIEYTNIVEANDYKKSFTNSKRKKAKE